MSKLSVCEDEVDTSCVGSEGETLGQWLERAIQEFQLVAATDPTDCSDLYDRLAQVTERIPPPRNHLDTICARYLLQCACIRLASPSAAEEIFTRVGSSPGWTSVWTALKLISAEHWPRLPAELRALAARHRCLQSLPRRVEAHLKANFTHTCRLPDIARGAGASIRVMTGAFKREHRCTIHQYVTLLRLRAAVRLLVESDLKIAAITESVGWNSQADFYRHLRRFAPVSPGAARLDKSNVSTLLNQFDEWLGSHGLSA